MTGVLRVAVVGAGPAGVYATEALLRYAGDVLVDVLDGLPAPYGLVRYGVAPDHPRTQSIADALGTVLSRPGVRFLGNVHVGADLTPEELREPLRRGARRDRRGGGPPDGRAGGGPARLHLGHRAGRLVQRPPRRPPDRFRLDARTVVVVGAGNVAGDVMRMLARTPDELLATDVPERVLAAFADSAVRDVHLVARRGPVQARFTTRELRELGELAGADVLVDPADLELDDLGREQLVTSPRPGATSSCCRSWAGGRPPAGPAGCTCTSHRTGRGARRRTG